MDAEIRGYERAIKRSGEDPRKIGSVLLGADPDRFWVLVPRDRCVPGEGQAVQVTGYMRVGRRLPVGSGGGLEGRTVVTEEPFRLWAFSVLTVSDFVDFFYLLEKSQAPCFLWDRREGKQVTFYGHASYERVAVGWSSERP